MSPILITGDFASTSAQGVRYSSLFGLDGAFNGNYLVTYNQYTNAGPQWSNHLSIIKNSSNWYRVLNSILKRIVFPDLYLFRLRKYKAFLSHLFSSQHELDIVLGCSPFSLLLLGSFVRKANPNGLLVADLSDPFSFNMCNVTRPLHSRIARQIELACLPFFDHIVVLNEGIRDEYIVMYPSLAEKFVVIEQGVDEGFVEKVQKVSNQTNGNAIFTFLYAGGFYKNGRNPDELFKAIHAQVDICRLSVYGNIKKSLIPHGVGMIEYHRAIDKDRLAQVTTQADALVIMDNDYGYQVPGKTLETLSSGKPVLFIYNNEDSPTLKYVREANGVVWARNNADAIAAGIKKIVYGEYDKPSFNQVAYTWEMMRSKYNRLLGKGIL